MKLILIFTFLYIMQYSCCQTRNLKLEYNNGHIYAKGKVLKCSDKNKKGTYDLSVDRKIGKWTYYYQNGNTERIERYRKIGSCNAHELPDGLWQYFSEYGILIKNDVYNNGILWNSDIAKYYFNDQLAGEIQIRNGKLDTLKYIGTDTSNLIGNGDFSFYYGPPALCIEDGQNQIEKQIPFWFSPDNNTPDYYNQLRKLKNVPDNIKPEYDQPYNYIGLILYHKPTGEYSEYITGRISKTLSSDKMYCLKIRLRLSQNSGYYINRIGILFSDSIPIISKINSTPPQISFVQPFNDRNEWTNTCSTFRATGLEKYITLGGYNSTSETLISPINPINSSEGDYNQSAYYLIDKIELFENTMDCNCSPGENTLSEQDL